MPEKTHDQIKTETEVKFVIPDEDIFTALNRSTALDNFQLRPIGTKRNIDRYLDTADKHLFRAGYACRIRQIDKKQILALKSLTPPEENIHRRHEIEMAVDSDHPQAWTQGKAKDLVLGIIGEQQLQSLFTIYQTRHKYHVLLENQPIIELSLDEVSLNDANKIDYFELEGELLESGAEDDLRRFSQSLQDNWHLQPGTRSKFERALGAR